MYSERTAYPSAPPLDEEYERPHSNLYPDLDEDNRGPPPAYDEVYDEDESTHTAEGPAYGYPKRTRPQNEGNWFDDAFASLFTSVPYYVVMAPLYLVYWLLKWLILKPILAPFYWVKSWYTRSTYAYEAGTHYFPAIVRFGMWVYERLTNQRLSNEFGVAWDDYRYQWRHSYSANQEEEVTPFSIGKSIIRTIFWFLTAGYIGGNPPPLHNQRSSRPYSTPYQRQSAPRNPQSSRRDNNNNNNDLLSWASWIYKGGLSKEIYRNVMGQQPDNSRVYEQPRGRGSEGRSPKSRPHEQKKGRSNTYLKVFLFAIIAFLIYHFYQLFQDEETHYSEPQYSSKY